MTSRHAVAVRRRIRLVVGWALISLLAAGELWFVGQFVAGFDSTRPGWHWQGTPPMVERVNYSFLQ